jgi:hypothetical protein
MNSFTGQAKASSSSEQFYDEPLFYINGKNEKVFLKTREDLEAYNHHRQQA